MYRKILNVLVLFGFVALLPTAAFAGDCFWSCHDGAMSVYEASGGDIVAATNAFNTCYDAFCN